MGESILALKSFSSNINLFQVRAGNPVKHSNAIDTLIPEREMTLFAVLMKYVKENPISENLSWTLLGRREERKQCSQRYVNKYMLFHIDDWFLSDI